METKTVFKVIRPSYEISKLTPLDKDLIFARIEEAARTCYKSENKIDNESADRLIQHLCKKGHWAMIEFGGMITVKFIANRGFTHEIVRHRLSSFAQESTRYVNYNQKGFEFVFPPEFEKIISSEKIQKALEENQFWELLETVDKKDRSNIFHWLEIMQFSIDRYNNLQEPFLHEAMKNKRLQKDENNKKTNCNPQLARGVLPIDIKAEINVSANLREWRHIFKLRCHPSAHPTMHVLMRPLLREFKEKLPYLFNDIEDYDLRGTYCAGNCGESPDVFYGHVTMDQIQWDQLFEVSEGESIKNQIDEEYGINGWKLVQRWGIWVKDTKELIEKENIDEDAFDEDTLLNGKIFPMLIDARPWEKGAFPVTYFYHEE